MALAEPLITSDARRAAPVDLDAYFARIGYGGSRAPTLATLCAIAQRHPAAIPFEAIDVLLGLGVDLDPAAVDAKLIHARRGGYCFEQNGLLKRVLVALGFEVTGLVARVRWNQPADAPPMPRSHMVLRVVAEGEPWLVDVGFGSCVSGTPLSFSTRSPQRATFETYRLSPLPGGETLLAARIDDEWRPVYELSPEPQIDADYLVYNWYTSAHPRSHFRHNLILARTTPDARYTLAGTRLSVRDSDGGLVRTTLDADGIEQTLAEVFGLPVSPAWRPMIERVASAGDTP